MGSIKVRLQRLEGIAQARPVERSIHDYTDAELLAIAGIPEGLAEAELDAWLEAAIQADGVEAEEGFPI